MTDVEAVVVWEGPEALRPFLLPLDALEPFPGNPRRGDVAKLRESLRRFGQVLPALADPALGEGEKLRIVARHHLALAAAEEGWTHIAVIPHQFADEDEARGYLLADNRLGELGGYDNESLVEQLKVLHELDALQGTGYTADDLDERLAELRRLAAGPVSPISERSQREHRDPDTKELVLNYSTAQLDQVEIWMGIVANEKGTAGTSETVYAALEVAALALNS